MKRLQIKWDIKAKESLKAIYKYCKNLSLQAANNVKKDILEEARKLGHFPEKYQVEPYLGEPYRYRLVRHYKIIYRIKEDELRIVDIFDTQLSPKKLSLNQ